MLDIKFIRDNVEIVKKAIQNKKAKIDLSRLLILDEQRRSLIGTIEKKNQEHNEISETIAKESSGDLIEKGKKIKLEVEILESQLRDIESEFKALTYAIPNIPTDDTPIGSDESGNVVLRIEGQKPNFTFEPKEHWQLGKELDVIDNERAAKVAGTRFTYLKRELVLLEFAIVQYVLAIVTNRDIIAQIIEDKKLDLINTPFIPVVPPVFIRPEVLEKMGRLEPKEDRYHITSDDLYLIGSAEHTLGSMHMDETLTVSELPLRYIGFSTSFRREAGSYGKDTKGILRLHQFDKLEMESFSLPENSLKEQELLIAIQEYILSTLELHYRVVAICTGDMGTPDARQIDIETWMPGQNQFRETHTADLTTDFQSRRLNIKVKKDKKSQFLHMNDATAAALGRLIIAIMENYQQSDGSIEIPKILRPYMGNVNVIKR